MKVVELLEGAKTALAEVESVLDIAAKTCGGAEIEKLPLKKDLDYLLIQIGNVAQSARDFGRHVAELC